MRKEDEERKMHDEEMDYKKLIIDLIEKIVNQNQLKRIYRFVKYIYSLSKLMKRSHRLLVSVWLLFIILS